VSNFEPEHLEMLIDATGIVPAVNQVELHPRLPQSELREVHAQRGIATEAWGPLGQGSLLTHSHNHGRCRRLWQNTGPGID
jgi:2,5-diketo-D-gluconate reductase A